MLILKIIEAYPVIGHVIDTDAKFSAAVAAKDIPAIAYALNILITNLKSIPPAICINNYTTNSTVSHYVDNVSKNAIFLIY